ncbi:hypothetical protein FISHEDRAFT_37542 [Fistulina hepatica ATCC 64428]|uniref:Anti-proliferative protein domain-containing protein n=1 Tax=Fistulina hepatica ATCC 64428 TaxID=1128425 RepID=A0A0D7AJA6_9AGAR|nr:hypothetical protein FISHEDRAFT_37542 [Fistulina hepatica ATCC 64428]
MDTSLRTAVAHAVDFLLQPLHTSYPAAQLNQARALLEFNFAEHCAPTWQSRDPSYGSSSRRLSLSPGAIPPNCIYAVCLQSHIRWSDWIALLGNYALDLYVDPGCVSVSLPGDAEHVTIWGRRKTLAQQLLETDLGEENELFALIDDEVHARSWTGSGCDTPLARSSSSLSHNSSHSHSSSHSSSSWSADYSASSSSNSSDASQRHRSHHGPRRDRRKSGRIYVDTSRTDVTAYDGGKTGVLTGGVMLGCVSVAQCRI